LTSKSFENEFQLWDIGRVVTTKADNRKRVMIPFVEPGRIYAVKDNADGSFTLSAVKEATTEVPICRLVKEDGFTVVVPGQPIDEQGIKELLADLA
jgi:hypothetical protein